MSLENFLSQKLDNKYIIESIIGEGGMGAVFKAIHLHTKRPVAVKIILPQFMSSIDFIERFKREAEATGRLYHPNIVNVTDFGFAEINNSRVAYLVMEHLDGSTLKDMIEKEGPLPISYVVMVVEQVCLAMEEAHRQNIIHRDLKPDNIWLTPDRRGGFNVKVLDFGLAKLLDRQDSLSISKQENNNGIFNQPNSMTNTDQRLSAELGNTDLNKIDSINRDNALTKADAVLGTPTYMSPEQWDNLPLDSRSDIYSLGIIVYQMLSGELPFTGNCMKLYINHKQTPPQNILDKRKGLPVQFASTIMSALSKEIGNRPKSAKAFSGALSAQSEGTWTLLRKATSFYIDNLFCFLRVSLISHTLIILFIVLIISLMLFQHIIFSPWIVLFILFILGIFGEILAAGVNIAAFAFVVEKLEQKPLTLITWQNVFNMLDTRLNITESNTYKGYFLLFYKIFAIYLKSIKFGGVGLGNPLYLSILMLENIDEYNTNVRSQILVTALEDSIKKLRRFGFWFFLSPAVMIIFTVYGLTQLISLSAFTFICLSLAIVPIFSIFLYPMLAAAASIVYFRAKKANGEM